MIVNDDQTRKKSVEARYQVMTNFQSIAKNQLYTLNKCSVVMFHFNVHNVS